MSDDRKPTIRFRGFTDAESAEVVHVSADALDRALCGAAAEGRDQGLSWEWADKGGALSDELVRRAQGCDCKPPDYCGDTSCVDYPVPREVWDPSYRRKPAPKPRPRWRG